MTTSSPGDVPRSLAFYAVFYGGSVFLVLAALLAMALGTRLFRRTVDLWSRFHRLCMRGLLGIRVRVEGNLPEGQMLVAMKHESFFEAIDLPRLFPLPGTATVEVEGRLRDSVGPALAARGFKVQPPKTPMGGAQAIWIDWQKGTLTGGSDPRKDGCALGL